VSNDQDTTVTTPRRRPAQPSRAGSSSLGSSSPGSSSEREVPVEVILGAEREAVIVHNGVRYRLRITSNDKLILTK
jgi:hemin uptake protein HemP